MFLPEFIVAAVIGGILALLLCRGVGRIGPGPGAGFLFFFTLIFLSTLAAGIWLNPFDQVRGIRYWLMFGIIGIFDFLFIAALVPTSAGRNRTIEAGPPAPEKLTIGLTIFFWALVLILGGAVIARYIVTFIPELPQ